MLVDAETLDLGQGIDAILAGVPEDITGHVKPELFQSVLEVATTPCTTVAETTAQLRDLRRTVSEIAERNGYLVGAAGTHPFALAEEQKIVQKERYQELAAELGWIARQELIFGTHVHVAHRRPRQGDLRRRRNPPLPAAPARAVLQLAVLARRDDRDDVGAHRRLPRLPARRHPAALRHLGDLLAPRRADDGGGRDRRLHLPLVGRAPAPEPRHGRDPRLRPADAARGHGRAGGDDAVPRPRPRKPLRRRRGRWSRSRPSSSTTTRSARRCAGSRAT